MHNKKKEAAWFTWWTRFLYRQRLNRHSIFSTSKKRIPTLAYWRVSRLLRVQYVRNIHIEYWKKKWTIFRYCSLGTIEPFILLCNRVDWMDDFSLLLHRRPFQVNRKDPLRWLPIWAWKSIESKICFRKMTERAKKWTKGRNAVKLTELELIRTRGKRLAAMASIRSNCRKVFCKAKSVAQFIVWQVLSGQHKTNTWKKVCGRNCSSRCFQWWWWWSATQLYRNMKQCQLSVCGVINIGITCFNWLLSQSSDLCFIPVSNFNDAALSCHSSAHRGNNNSKQIIVINGKEAIFFFGFKFAKYMHI